MLPSSEDRPAAAVTFSAAAERVLARVREVLGVEMAVVSRRSGPDYVVLAASDDAFGVRAGGVLRWDDTFCARVVDGRARRFTPDVADEPAFAEPVRLLGLPARSYVSVPLRGADGELLGTLCAAGLVPRGPELLALQGEVELLADLLAAVLAAELHSQHDARAQALELRSDARDPLTGLPGRAAWEAALVAEEARCRRYGSAAAVLAVDLDGLRAVNATSGHEHGDELLRRATDALRASTRAHDLVARTGGDEFGVLLGECDADQAADVAERVRQALRDCAVPASVGTALRGRTGLPGAWSAARSGLVPTGGAPAGPRRARAAHVSPREDRLLHELLELARRQVGAAVSFVGAFEDSVRVLRAVSATVPLPVETGWAQDREETLCQRIVDGRLPEVIPDTAAEPGAAHLPVVADLGIGSYVGVPVVLPDGRLYGTLCCLSPEPDPSLSAASADVLRAIADSMARVLAGEEAERTARHAVLARLDAVLTGRSTRMVFQPVVSLRDGRVVGGEALARFTAEPLRGPDAWFADAERVGLLTELELSTAALAVEGGADLPGFLAVNFSATTICSPGFAALASRLDLARFVVEISEREQIPDYGAVLAVLGPLRARGLRLAVDDAGAGFASLRHVVLLAPDIIKLDLSLVRGIDTDPVRQALATALTGFARQTGAEVVAEGVETEAERDVVARVGITLVQGWLLGAGVPPQEFVQRWGAAPPVPGPRASSERAVHLPR